MAYSHTSGHDLSADQHDDSQSIERPDTVQVERDAQTMFNFDEAVLNTSLYSDIDDFDTLHNSNDTLPPLNMAAHYHDGPHMASSFPSHINRDRSSRHNSAPPAAVGGVPSIYPPYQGLFRTSQQATIYRRQAMMFDRAPYLTNDPTIWAISNARGTHIKHIYDAMIRSDVARDNKGSVAMKRWVFKQHYPHDLIETVAHRIFDALMDQVKYGFRGWTENDFNKDEKKCDKEDKDADCTTRLENIIFGLGHEKTICEDVMSSMSHIREFVNGPKAYANRKMGNRKGNNNRSENHKKQAAATDGGQQASSQRMPALRYPVNGSILRPKFHGVNGTSDVSLSPSANHAHYTTRYHRQDRPQRDSSTIPRSLPRNVQRQYMPTNIQRGHTNRSLSRMEELTPYGSTFPSTNTMMPPPLPTMQPPWYPSSQYGPCTGFPIANTFVRPNTRRTQETQWDNISVPPQPVQQLPLTHVSTNSVDTTIPNCSAAATPASPPIDPALELGTDIAFLPEFEDGMMTTDDVNAMWDEHFRGISNQPDTHER